MKPFKYFSNLIKKKFKRDYDDIKIQNGQKFSLILNNNLKNINSLEDVYFKIFSQNSEDGVLIYLLKSLGIKKHVKFVEIGTQDYSESNTRYIFETMNSTGLIIDPTKDLFKKISSYLKIWKNSLEIHNDFIDSDNIKNILAKYNFNENLDLLSIDIDGIDYWVIKSLPDKISKIIVAEYNPYFGSKLEVTVPNIKKFDRFKYNYTGLCFGTSLKALVNLLDRKGYTFVGSNDLNNNAFFVRRDLISKISVKVPTTKDLSIFTDTNFRNSVDKEGKLNYLNKIEILDKIKNCEVTDIITGKKTKFGDLDY